ncbi:hypothetical protein PHISCL_01145 [Aspergillus sclerotialis]|uniref:Nitrogen regulatory protein areA GATA-like domain-containing protein n=1 Tax=Aspergillus sclerotialis TaxID=2070753 RepID=A0A3A2ZTQ4_9EURO|nr:hypothetical protein PHISCL_01145 [Aspergillus sclerotialis]
MASMPVLLPSPFENHSRLPPESRRSPVTQRYFLDDRCTLPKSSMFDYPQKECPSPTISSAPSSRTPSPDFTQTNPEQLPYSPSTLSSLSLDTADDDDSYDDHDDDDDELLLPSYDQNLADHGKEQVTPDDLDEYSIGTPTDTPRWGCQIPAVDDTAIEIEPSRHVDYLSHEWREEDLWSSWRYIAARKHAYNNGVRLENASWRTWAKYKLNLGTVSPEALNWLVLPIVAYLDSFKLTILYRLKDCDVTWLYGPLKTYSQDTAINSHSSPPPSDLETPGMDRDRKPILKKKSASEMMLQRSLLQHTLLQHAGAILKAQEAEHDQHRYPLPRPVSKFGRMTNSSIESRTTSFGSTLTNTSRSGVATPTEGRRIHFNNEVAQCIAVEAKDAEEDEYWPTCIDDDWHSHNSVSTMKQIFPDTAPDSSNTPRNSINTESKIIAPLPSTTLKYRGDTPEPPATSFLDSWYGRSSAPSSSPTPSEKTIRPSTPQANFLLDDEDEDHEGPSPWQPQRQTFNFGRAPSWLSATDDELELEQSMGSFGNLLPYEDSETPDTGIVERMVDAVNTAKDIAHVIWNVGWRG